MTMEFSVSLYFNTAEIISDSAETFLNLCVLDLTHIYTHMLDIVNIK